MNFLVFNGNTPEIILHRKHGKHSHVLYKQDMTMSEVGNLMVPQTLTLVDRWHKAFIYYVKIGDSYRVKRDLVEGRKT